MKKQEIARQLARKTRVTQAEAADRLDSMVRKILSELRQGYEVSLPGLGRLRKGADGHPAFERDGGEKRA